MLYAPGAAFTSPAALRRSSGKIRVSGFLDHLIHLMGSRSTNDERRLTSTGFSRLLARLGADSEEAAAQYERLRAALEKFFDWHGAWPPEECADETLDRLVRKLESEIEIVDVRRYALGIARLVLLEWQRRPATLSSAGRPETAQSTASVSMDYEDEPLHACFDRCLAALPADSRTLVLEYYAAERRAKIDNRRRLAQAVGVSESALRNRVQRVRDRLERCVHRCTSAAAEIGLDAAVRQPVDLRRSDEA
jgi:DNA-directed RNA polymerase specialized sigma24 family protein